MKKFCLTSNGKQVQKGDLVHFKKDRRDAVIYGHVTLTEDTIPILLREGIITAVESPTIATIDDCFSRIADRLNWPIQKVKKLISAVVDVYPMAAFNILVKEIAVSFDEKYPDHINKSEKIYTISPLDGRIHEICKAHIKNYRNFAAFRTVEDAKAACSILREPLKGLFSNGK